MTPETVKRSPDAFEDILKFWFEESGRRKWFSGGLSFDAEIRDRFGVHHQAAASGLLDHWTATPRSCLALLIILDQFSRNMFRRDPRAFAMDAHARSIAGNAIIRRFDLIATDERRTFFYMPFMHSEILADQRKCVAYFKARLAGADNIPFAVEHMEIIERFGRFPHRNQALGRISTPDEIRYLSQGGFAA
ncbi:MAG: DUF924 domain-containing protein [Parvularculaceae bacterium]|nr:DUF924 domain-containing protein [Parvularculaceae bacterium]